MNDNLDDENHRRPLGDIIDEEMDNFIRVEFSKDMDAYTREIKDYLNKYHKDVMVILNLLKEINFHKHMQAMLIGQIDYQLTKGFIRDLSELDIDSEELGRIINVLIDIYNKLGLEDKGLLKQKLFLSNLGLIFANCREHNDTFWLIYKPGFNTVNNFVDNVNKRIEIKIKCIYNNNEYDHYEITKTFNYDDINDEGFHLLSEQIQDEINNPKDWYYYEDSFLSRTINRRDEDK